MPDRDVAGSLAEAAVAISSQDSVDDTLESIVHTARLSLEGIDHVGISVAHRDGKVETRAATDEFVWELDQLQYDLGEGPCLFSMTHEQTTLVEHARHEQRWPRFIQEAVKRGLRSQLALQLYFDDRTLAGLNMYSTTRDTLDQDTVDTAELFATHAAIALGKVREIDNLNQALRTRKVIGQAIGIVMERFGVTEDRAFAYLRRASSTENVKLRLVAQQLVEDTENRGAARRAGPGHPHGLVRSEDDAAPDG
jgi:transcriptional regulator with GAF, ATPase, and Fis domain